MAAVLFDDFSSATTMRNILGLYRSICDTISLRAAPINEFYPKLKSKIRSWKAQALWKKFDARASHKGNLAAILPHTHTSVRCCKFMIK